MSLNVLEQAKSYFNNEVINRASTQLNETESGVSKAINLILPAVMGWITDKASTADGASQILDLAKSHASEGVLNPIEHLLQAGHNEDSMRKGQSALSDIFGPSHQTDVDKMASEAGIKPTSISGLFSVAIPTVLGIIGKHLNNGDFSVATMAGFLGGAGRIIDVPVANVATHEVVDVAPVVPVAPAFVPPVVNTPHEEQKLIEAPKKSSNSWLWLLLLLLIGLGIWWFFFKNKNSMETNKVTSDSTVVITKHVVTGRVGENGDFFYDEGDSITIKLPNTGAELRVGKYSTEAQLVEFLNDKNQMVDTVKGNWFEFTNVHFKLNSADLTEVSNRQLNNIVAISKAYPNAKFKFGGYTDTTGNMAINLPLSQQRAEVISALVEKLGADKMAIVDAKGYGSQYPVASNETPEGRAQNRRVAIDVKEK